MNKIKRIKGANSDPMQGIVTDIRAGESGHLFDIFMGRFISYGFLADKVTVDSSGITVPNRRNHPLHVRFEHDSHNPLLVEFLGIESPLPHADQRHSIALDLWNIVAHGADERSFADRMTIRSREPGADSDTYVEYYLDNSGNAQCLPRTATINT